MTASTCTCGCGGHDERHAPAPPHNPPGRAALDYRVGRHADFLAAMLDRLASPAYPALRGLTTRDPADPAIALADATAVLGDLLTFHTERNADESYLRTAGEHRSLALLGRLVGHRPRPGLAADTHLAYTVDRDLAADGGTEVLIPRGSRSNSVPMAPGEEPHTFETDADLVAREAWNELKVRRRRPTLIVPEDLRQRSEVFVAGTDTGLAAGDRLLFLFGRRRELHPVSRVRTDRDDDVTAVAIPVSPPPTLAELVDELRQWIVVPDGPPPDDPTPEIPNPRPVSGLIQAFDAQVLAPLRADVPRLTTPEAYVRRLADPLARLAEAQVLAAAYEEVAAWFEQLAAVLADLRERAAELGSVPLTAAADDQLASAAVRALQGVLPALRARTGRAPEAAAEHRLDAGADLGARLLAALNPAAAGDVYEAWRRTGRVLAPVPDALRELIALRVQTAPFGVTAPLRPVQDEHGRVIQQADWPLAGSALTTMRVVFETSGKDPVRAEFIHAEGAATAQSSAALPANVTIPLGPGEVELSTTAGEAADITAVTARLTPQLPTRTLVVRRPGEDGRIHVEVQGGPEPVVFDLAPGADDQKTSGDYEVTARYTTSSEPDAVEIGISTVPAAERRKVLPLEGEHPEITPGSWIAIERPDKGAPGDDGIPGSRRYAKVLTKVTEVRTVGYAAYGITGRGTQVTLSAAWLDERDTLLSHIRGTTVHAAGDLLDLAGEPLGEDVHGNEIELAGLYDGLTAGRAIAVTGERTDVPHTPGLTATELAVIARVEHGADPQLPGDHVHTTLTLTADLGHRYRRESVRLAGNVVPASHGETRDEPIGSGDSGQAHQTFALWQHPLTWLPAANATGARPALEIRVDGLRWTAVDGLAGRGPRERVYVLGADAAGRTTVTFGDGVHGARLPTGQDNVRARYRHGSGAAANVPAGRITQAVSRPLGVTAVTNPIPASGGTDPDGPGLTRRTIPLAVAALDRLVSVSDYEDFARSRTGIGRAAARELYDGRRPVLHVTVTGSDDVPLDQYSDALPALRAALARHGDDRLPVRVDVRELVLLVLAAKVRLLPEYDWQLTEPRIRAALLARLGYPGGELAQPARLSEVLATIQAVAGVDWVDVDTFTGIRASVTPDELSDLAAGLDRPATAVPARPAEYDEVTHRVTAADGETLTAVAAQHAIPLAELLRLNPDITDTQPLRPGRAVLVFRGIRPAQLARFAPEIADTIILTEVRR
ncbi:putative baseplate assembly protein [Streptomyces boninensis]|uniref:putative baseplate assembly protein n=1 Tax=Streptomyces boninensis TaxID=2039455 RepID=UPI003B2129A8